MKFIELSESITHEKISDKQFQLMNEEEKYNFLNELQKENISLKNKLTKLEEKDYIDELEYDIKILKKALWGTPSGNDFGRLRKLWREFQKIK